MRDSLTVAENPPREAPAEAAAAQPDDGRGEFKRMALRGVIGVVVLVAIVVLLERYLHDEVVSLGRQFVDRFGLWGMALGTFLADGFHFPVPPQFYLLTAITTGGNQVAPVAVICAASLAAGTLDYKLARYLARLKFFRKWLERTRGRVDGLFKRHGYLAIAIGSASPVPFSTLCYLAGLYRIPYRHFALFTLLRIPRILVFYFAIRAGWT